MRFLDQVVVSEVSPVLSAASIGTGTVEVRGTDPQQLELQRLARELQRAPPDDVRREKCRHVARRGNDPLAAEIERARSLGIKV